MHKASVLIPGILIVVTAGCGGSAKLQTRGCVVVNGAPLVPAAEEIVRVTFVPLPEGGGPAMDFYAATVNPDNGTFQVAGKDGKGVPPGNTASSSNTSGKRRTS
jgi:hypothetical protein